MNDVKRTGNGYLARGVTFAYMTTAVLFLLIVESGDLRGAVEWKERYAL